MRRRGFTLLELLTVIAILGLLMGILVPALSSARQSAKANVCLSKIKGIATAFTIYLNENRDTFPPFRLKKLNPTDTEEYVNEYQAKAPRWQWFLEVESGPVIDPRPFARLQRPWGDEEPGFGDRTMTMTNEVFTCPALDDPEFSHNIRNGAYGYNYQYLGNTRQDPPDDQRFHNFPVTLHRIKSPAQTVLMADSRGAGMPHGIHAYAMDPPRLATEAGARRFSPDAEHVPPGQDPEKFRFSPVEMRHKGYGNVAFIDNHAEAMKLPQLGYEIADVDRHTGVAIPVLEAANAKKATNKLWNGLGQDPLVAARSAPPPGP